MTIDFSFLTEITTELERVRAIEAMCQIGLVLAKDSQNVSSLQKIFGIISLLNISVLPVRLDSFKPLITNLKIED